MTANPDVLTCIIAERARQEAGGKVTLLGVYGVAPYVRIGVRELPTKLSLAFYIATKRFEEQTEFSIKLRGPDRELIGESDEKFLVAPPAAPQHLVSALVIDTDLVLKNAGSYHLELYRGGDLWTSVEFGVNVREQGNQEGEAT